MRFDVLLEEGEGEDGVGGVEEVVHGDEPGVQHCLHHHKIIKYVQENF